MQECFPRSQLLCWDEKRGAQGSRHRWVASQARGLPGALLEAKRRYWQGRKSAASDLWSFTIFLDFPPLFSDFRKA